MSVRGAKILQILAIIIGAVYLIMMMRIRTETGSKAAVIVTALLVCILSVVVEPVLYSYESRQNAMFAAETDAQTVMAFIAVRSAMREISVLVLFVSKALTFLSLGGFWKNALLVQNREQPVQDTEQSLES